MQLNTERSMLTRKQVSDSVNSTSRKVFVLAYFKEVVDYCEPPLSSNSGIS